MHFASKYVLDCDPEYEYVSDDEYEEGMAISDDEADHGDLAGGSADLAEVSRSAEQETMGRGGSRGPGLVPLSRSMVHARPPPPPLPCSLAVVPPPPPPSAIAPFDAFDGAPPPAPPPIPQRDRTEHHHSRGAPKKKHHWRSGERSPPQSTTGEQSQQRGRRFRRADTNVVSIKFDKLESPSTMHAGDATICSGCQAILSHISKLVQDGSDKVWVCEFCKRRNEVDIEEEEIPDKDDVTFLVEPALATSASGPSGHDDSLVIFVIDISGSMCVTTEVSGRMNLRGARRLQEKMRGFVEDHASQFLPHQSHNVTYISRLQAVQAAVDHQLEEMARSHTHRRVALITFNNEVQVVGDGSSDMLTIAGDKLTNMETLSKMGCDLAQPQAIKETRKTLSDRLFALEEGGGTALGPALVVATHMASRHPGSKVILCTDGLANVGLGRLDQEETDDLYETVSQHARDKGVAISVITIKGTSCKLVELGKLADQTGGQVNIVDPLKLTEEFSTILADRILATNVEATFIVHRDLFIFNEDTMESRMVRKIGNVTKDSEVTFEYSRRPKEEKKATKGVTVPDAVPEAEEQAEKEAEAAQKAATEGDVSAGKGDSGKEAGESSKMETSEAAGKEEGKASGMETTETSGKEGGSSGKGDAETAAGKEEKKKPAEFPFQLQISYLDSDGTKALRVFTQTRPVTADRSLAEINADLDVLGKHAAQKTAQLALAGDYTLSRGTALMHQRLAWRSCSSTDSAERRSRYHSAFSPIQSLENRLNLKQKSERSRMGSTLSDEDSGSDEEAKETPMMDVADGAGPPRPPRLPPCPAPRGASGFLAGRKKGSKAKKRSKEVEDDMACEIYDMMN